MDLRWPLVLVGLLLLTVALLLWWARRGGERRRGGLLVAHVARLAVLPRFRTLVRQRVAITAFATAAALVTLTAGAVLAARPQEVTTEYPQQASRDLVLCLDASGSMASYNVQVINEFRSIVDGLDGERVGLTIFSGAAITIFPLTDDYAFVDERLDEAERAFSSEDYDFVAGTVLNDKRASLAGDGLVSCTQRFDDGGASAGGGDGASGTDEAPDEVEDGERGRAVVLATDNEQQGESVYTLEEAGEYAAERDVRVYGIGTEGIEPETGELTEMQRAVELTGGTYATLGTDGSASSIVDAIDELERARIDSDPVVTVAERPVGATVALGVGVGLLALAWLVEGLMVVLRRRS